MAMPPLLENLHNLKKSRLFLRVLPVIDTQIAFVLPFKILINFTDGFDNNDIR